MLQILHGHTGLERSSLSAYDGIEVDLRMTKDNVVVVSHDRRIQDANGRALWIDRFTESDISHSTDKKLVRFEDVLDHIQKKHHASASFVLELDIKQLYMEDQVFAILTKARAFSYFSEIIISSPRVGVLSAYSEKSKNFSLALTDAPLDKWDLWDMKMFRYITLVIQYTLKPLLFRLIRRKTNREEIQIANIFHQLINLRLVEFLHENHIRVFAYGVRSPKQLERLIRFGVDGVKLKHESHR